MAEGAQQDRLGELCRPRRRPEPRPAAALFAERRRLCLHLRRQGWLRGGQDAGRRPRALLPSCQYRRHPLARHPPRFDDAPAAERRTEDRRRRRPRRRAPFGRHRGRQGHHRRSRTGALEDLTLLRSKRLEFADYLCRSAIIAAAFTVGSESGNAVRGRLRPIRPHADIGRSPQCMSGEVQSLRVGMSVAAWPGGEGIPPVWKPSALSSPCRPRAPYPASAQFAKREIPAARAVSPSTPAIGRNRLPG
ncbi:hypothetical protein RHECNPAF_890058 [Rhizobium etli CNPAF512]|nr:hypothetical protein RHECNPAF_890058 [Rhizobium etli CNPAF512]